MALFDNNHERERSVEAVRKPTSIELIRDRQSEKSKDPDRLITVGWREWVGLPELGIAEINAKVDTGARTSVLHALNLHSFRRNGEPWARFDVFPIQDKSVPVVRCEAPVRDHREVKNSKGHKDLRVVVETSLSIAGQQWPIEVTLTNRRDMRFRMLLGRTALRGKILVDPDGSFLANK